MGSQRSDALSRYREVTDGPFCGREDQGETADAAPVAWWMPWNFDGAASSVLVS